MLLEISVTSSHRRMRNVTEESLNRVDRAGRGPASGHFGNLLMQSARSFSHLPSLGPSRKKKIAAIYSRLDQTSVHRPASFPSRYGLPVFFPNSRRIATSPFTGESRVPSSLQEARRD